MSKYSGLVMTLAAAHAFAADWSADPRIALSAVYNDNNRLTDVSGSEIEVSGARLDAQLAIGAKSPRTTFQLTPRLRSSFYPGDSDEEANDHFVRMQVRHAMLRGSASLDVDYSSMVTLGNYFPSSTVGEDDVLGDPDRGVGIGRLGQRNRQERLTFAPEISFDLSERRSLEFRAEYLDVGYDFTVPGDREDYSDTYGSAAFRMALSETSSLALRGTYSVYDPSDGDSSDAHGLDAEWSNRLSETAKVYVRAGVSRVESGPSNGGGSSKWESGFTGGAGVNWAFEVTEVWLDVGRNLDPDSVGEIVTRDQLRVQVSRRLTPMTRVYVGGRIIKDSGATNDKSFADRTYSTANVGFDWRFARQWTLFGTYDYARRKYENAPTDAKSNAVNFGVVYEPNRR